jgi:hypothetical protein
MRRLTKAMRRRSAGGPVPPAEAPADPGIGSRDVLAVASALLVLMFLVKLYGVARYSLTTTTGLLVATPWQVALGTVTIYAYYVLPAVAVGTIWAAVLLRRRLRWAVWPVAVIVAVVTALASPLAYLLQALAVVGVALAAELLLRRLLARRRGWVDRGRRRRMLEGLRGLSAAYLGAAVLAYHFLATLQTPWVSAQAFKLDTTAVISTQPYSQSEHRFVAPNARYVDIEVADHLVGYPIAEEGDWLTILHADTRHLVRVPVSAVRARLTCHSEDDQLSGDRPLLEALRGGAYHSPNMDCREVLAYLIGLPSDAPLRDGPRQPVVR